MKKILEEDLNVECKLTREEKLKYSEELAENINQKKRTEDSLKSYKSQAKSEIEKAEASINLLSQKISSGKEYRAVKCKVEYDWDKKTRSWIREDTGEVVKDDIIPEELFQQNMDV